VSAVSSERTDGPAAAPRVVITVGTDHHPFDRLIAWTNDWLGQHQDQAGLFFAQYGTSRVTPACPGERLLPASRLAALLAGADVVICHGGPGTIAEAWSRGHLPIVVPRRHRLGEHVDDHQVEFCGMLAELGHIRLVTTSAQFGDFLPRAAAEGRGAGTRGPLTDVDTTIARFGALVDDLVAQQRRYRRMAGRPKKAGTKTPPVTSYSPAEDRLAAGSDWREAIRAAKERT
jgi:UDP-N-acetylglucosamine transferase subunit ALG13